MYNQQKPPNQVTFNLDFTFLVLKAFSSARDFNCNVLAINTRLQAAVLLLLLRCTSCAQRSMLYAVSAITTVLTASPRQLHRGTSIDNPSYSGGYKPPALSVGSLQEHELVQRSQVRCEHRFLKLLRTQELIVCYSWAALHACEPCSCDTQTVLLL